jgi:hypothetical protein
MGYNFNQKQTIQLPQYWIELKLSGLIPQPNISSFKQWIQKWLSVSERGGVRLSDETMKGIFNSWIRFSEGGQLFKQSRAFFAEYAWSRINFYCGMFANLWKWFAQQKII